MFCSEQVSGSMKTFRIAGAVGIAALVVALGVGASPAAALAKKHKAAADDRVAGTGVVDSAAAPDAACGTTFSTCCTITASGVYTLSASFTANSGTGTCVAIGNAGGSITNVVVNLAGFTITQATANNGKGTGIGITGASGFNTDSQNVYLEGLNGGVSGFATGVSVSLVVRNLRNQLCNCRRRQRGRQRHRVHGNRKQRIAFRHKCVVEQGRGGSNRMRQLQRQLRGPREQ